MNADPRLAGLVQGRDYIIENGAPHSTGASDGHIWNLFTGECSPLCPSTGKHSGPLTYDDGGITESELRLLDGNR